VPSAAITIDAGNFALPQINCGAETARGYVERILDWAKLLDKPWIAICVSESASNALFEDDLFPLRDKLRQLFLHYGIIEYDSNTVAAAIDGILQRTPSFETYYRVRDALHENLTTAPDVMQFCTGRGLQNDLARCMLLLAVLRRHCSEDILQNALILPRCSDRTVRVRAQVHEIEHDRTDLSGGIPAPPQYFEGDVLCCDDFQGLLDCIDEEEVLIGATDIGGIELAIRITLFKWRHGRLLDPDWDDFAGLHIGNHFRRAVQTHLNHASSAVRNAALRSICETIDGQNLTAVHSLRTGSGGGSPQRRRPADDAKAWRRDIDYEYHLHYWELHDGSVELASIGVHSDFSIPE
jgi:hypothetical protein